MQALKINPDGTWERITLSPEDQLKQLQEHVGGYVEYAPSRYPGEYEVIVNEEGHLKGLEYNPYATDFSVSTALVGPVVILGPTDEEGDITGLPEMIAEFITRILPAN